MPEIKYAGAPKLTPEEGRRTAAIPEYNLRPPDLRFSRAGVVAGEAIESGMKDVGRMQALLGHSISTLGTTMEGAGTELFNRAVGLKQLETETEVNNATIKWETNQNKMDEEFLSKSGEQANSAALAAHLKMGEDERQKARNSLSSPQAQKMFDSQTTRPFIAASRGAMRHAATEVKKQAQQAVEAKLNLGVNAVISNDEDADKRARLEDIDKIVNEEWRYLHGANDDQVRQKKAQLYAKAIIGSAQRMAEKDAGGALRMLEANKHDLDEIDAEGYTKAHAELLKKKDQVDTRNLADDASGNRDETYEQKETRMIEDINKKFPERANDPNFLKQATNELKNRHAIDRAKFEADRAQANDLSDSVLHGREPGQEGKMPKTWEEYMAYPGVKEAYPRLSEKQKDAVQTAINANARGNYPDTAGAQREFQNWMGEFENDPEFMRKKREETPGWWNDLEIPEHYRTQLWARDLRAIREDGKHADKYIRPKTIIERGTQSGLIPDNLNKVDKNLLAHRISAEINAWRQMNPKKVPTEDDENMFIKRARTGQELPGFLWGTNVYEQYKIPVEKLVNTKEKPNEYKDASDAYKALHPGAPQEEIDQAILNAYVLRKLRGATAPATPSKSVKTVPVTP